MNTPNSIVTALQYQRTGRLAEAEQVYKLLLQEQPHSIDALNLLGALVYEDKRFEEAQDCFEKVLSLQPGAESHNSMGIVLKAQGKYEEAVEHYEKALALKPNQPEVLSNLGNALKETGKLAAAIAAYEQAIALNPAYAEAHNNLGIVYKEQQKLDDAIACYEAAIRLKPNYADAHHNLGIILQIQGQPEAAANYFRQAIALKPNYAEAYTSLGLALQQQGKLEDAIAQYRRLIELKPNDADGFNNLALALQQQHQVDEAIAAFQQALVLRPQFPGVYNNLGNLWLEKQQVDAAIAHYQQAISQRPNYPEALNNLGNALQQKGDLDGAIAQYHKALQLRPNFVEALSNLGSVLKDKHQLEAAVSYLEQAVALSPTIGEIHNNLGNVYQEQKRIDEAIASYQKAVELKPEMAEVHSNLGNMLQYIGEFEAAFEHFETAIATQPDFAGAYNNLGIAYRNAGRVQEAFAAYEQAIAINPDFVEAHWNTALNHLLLGDFEQGFAGYEWRFQWSRFLEQNPSRSYTQPRWDGTPLGDQTIYIYAEQGLGDTIQFIRYIPLVKAKGGRIILECHPPLLNLLKNFPGIDQLVPLGGVPPAFDVHAPLLSLPYIFGTTLETIPAQIPYLHPEAKTPSSPDLQPLAPDSFKIGIVWDGNPQNPYNRSRSVPLAELLTLADLPGVTLYSLQKEPKPEDLDLLQAHPDVQDLRSQLHDFTDTAALIQQMDLIISIDTAVTHLAGALGKPTWLLLPLAPDWRWMCDRADSPWYPTLRLFRQSHYGDWQTVMAAVRQALAEKLGIQREVTPGKQKGTRQNGKKKEERRREKFKSQKSGVGKQVAGRSQSPSPPVSQSPMPRPTSPQPTKIILPAALQSVVKLHQGGQVAAARRDCEAFLQTHPDSADGWHLLGLMAHYERKLDEAIAHYQRALQADTHHLDTYNNLAVALHERGNVDDAMPYYQKAIALNSQGADAHNNYANALRERGRLDEAILHYEQAIAARPDYADAYNNLGLAYYAKEDYANAAVAYRQAIARKPNFPQALNHLGNALKELGHWAEAATYYQQAIALKPDYAKAYNNWGNIFRDNGDLQTAIQYYDQATAIEPNFAEAHWNKALTFLLGGDLQRGFEEYEWRRHVNLPTFKSLRDFPGPRWDGSPLNGQIIYLHAEQGMGDVIQFVRYVPLVVQQGGRVILECHPPLMHLLRHLPGVEQLIPYGAPPPSYHTQAPLLSLPYIFGTSAATVPATVPYLTPPHSPVQLPDRPPIATPHPSRPAPLKVGLVWSGNPENPYNRTRALPLDLLLPLAALPQVQVYSLQKDLQPGEEALLQANPAIADLRPLLADFVDTAALIQQLDLIISIDTAVTHLAGALGKPTWLLLPFAPDWRWMLHREYSPWYPTLRIFRQSTAGDWTDVLQQVQQALTSPPSLNPAPTPPTPPPTLAPTPALTVSQLLTNAFSAYQQGQLVEAERLYRLVLQIQPEQADALHVLGVILCQSKRFVEAETLIRRLVDLQPDFADGWRNLGGVLQEQGQFEAAIASYQRALTLDPHNADVHQNLSTVLLEVNQPLAAVTQAEQVIALQPDAADAYYNLGYALRRAGQVQAAIAQYQRAIALQPDMALAHKNLGHALLLTGDFLQGFEEIEWRWQQPGWTRRPFTQPEWDGSDLTGKTILLYAEQGMGDTLQFIRYVPLVKAKGGQVLVECQPELIPLLAQLPGCDRWMPQDSPLPAFDLHAPLMSLPRLFHTTLETIPADIPYLTVDPTPAPPHPRTPHPLKVGIVWAGNPNHRNDRWRSCALEQFHPLFELAEVNFYSLQKGAAEQQLQAHPEFLVYHLGDRLQTFMDTATAIAELDLVITVDTAVAHLAGAMGKPVWVLLMFAADWRWIIDRDDTPWYPTMRLFRQTSPGDWAGVFERVQQELEREIAARREPPTESRQESASPHAPTSSPRRPLTFHCSWPLSDRTDAGILGTQLMLYGLQQGQFEPVLRQELTAQSHGHPVVRSRLAALKVDANPALEGWGLTWVDDRQLQSHACVHPERQVALVAMTSTHLEPLLIEQLQQFRAIVVGSTWSANILHQYGLNPVQVPLQGVDPAWVVTNSRTELLRDRFVVFATSNCFVQGQDILIAAFKAFQSRHADALLMLSDVQAEFLQDANLPDHACLLLGPIPYPFFSQVLRETDVAVFPSRCEPGVNQAIAASLACGVPTVLSNNTANRDLVQYHLGFPLHTQRPVKAAGCEGWGESEVEELVETLEYIYSHHQEAKNRGAIAADFVRDWTWKQQIQQIWAAIAPPPL
ncbi:MAG: tetratricopeptide repeat protein [Leptolyngbyaceae cyanobacterium bins.349]|nr:tetratricopeptide repeat protein [Leptolyngbyaceae cyanobacterium bins.349]